jgi:glycosyltransferase
MPIVPTASVSDIYSNQISGDLPTISVITICRNAETTLESTMLSVVSQTYMHIEYIIVDGLSSDHTASIARQVANRFPKRNIKIISEADRGIADAMNKGVQFSTGEIITHLHAGDRYIDNSVINKVVRSYMADSWRWGVAGSIVVNEVGNEGHIFRAQGDYKALLKKNCIPHQSTFFFRDIFNKHGFFNEKYKQAMDYEYWMRIAFKGGERFTILPFDTTYFMAGGRSSDVFELLRYLYRLRKSLSGYGCKVLALDDFIFFSRVIVFHVFYELKRKLRIL